MAYQTGSATGVVDLLTQFKAFCEANGWTTDSSIVDGLGRRWHAHNGTVYVNMRAYVAETPDVSIAKAASGASTATSIAMNVGTGYSGAASWFAQPGVCIGLAPPYQYITAGANGLTSAIPAYHFFAQNSGESILCVIEYLSGYYQMWGFGTLNKFGAYTGGEYYFGSLPGVADTIVITPNTQMPGTGFFPGGAQSLTADSYAASFIKADVDSETGWHASNKLTTGQISPHTRRCVADNRDRFVVTLAIQPNTMNSRSIMMPVVAYMQRDTNNNTATLLSPLGELPETFWIDMTLLTPAQQIVLGSDEYRVFPFFHKNAGALYPSVADGHSGRYGFAVKE